MTTTLCEPVTGTMVREATQEDRGEILELVARLATESPYTQTDAPNRAHFTAQVDAILAHPQMAFLVAEHDGCLVGLLGLTCYQDLISGEGLAAELCWYVTPEQRGRAVGLSLLEAAEAYASAHGATRLQMLAPASKFTRYLGRRGYVMTQQLCERRL